MIDPDGSVESKKFENNREYPVREANYSMNVRDFGLIGKISPREILKEILNQIQRKMKLII
jgi:hypothetical protein